MREQRRGGLALIELISISAVFLILVAFQLPLFLRSRESARLAQCTNNLKQIGLGMHNYHATNDRFPMSSTQGAGHANGHACLTALLPYMEQTAVYNAYNFDLENWHMANTTAVGVKLNTFLCPANPGFANTNAPDIRDQHDKVYPGKAVFGPSHYGANWGGVRQASGDEAFKAYPGSHLGVILTVVDPDAKTPTKNIKFTDVTDGTSMTIAFAEKLDGFGWAVGGWGGSEFDVNTTCFYEGKDAKQKRVFTGSTHSGGINVMLVDGSVRFLKSNTDRKLWYALTTRAGGERIELE